MRRRGAEVGGEQGEGEGGSAAEEWRSRWEAGQGQGAGSWGRARAGWRVSRASPPPLLLGIVFTRCTNPLAPAPVKPDPESPDREEGESEEGGGHAAGTPGRECPRH